MSLPIPFLESTGNASEAMARMRIHSPRPSDSWKKLLRWAEKALEIANKVQASVILQIISCASSKQTKSQRSLIYDFPVRGVSDTFKSKVGDQFENQFNAEKIQKDALKQALNTANGILKVLSKPSVQASNITKTDSVKGFVGAVRAGAGAIFDAAVTTALNLKASPSGEGGDFDVFGSVGGLSKIFGKNPLATGGFFAGLGDFKFTSGAQKSMKQKTFKQLKID